ncbi:MAG: hypothetical protein CBD27_01650 [Rhodospirillaceae bacterium TMED167]|nr:MAG: hypothetical protein CBD27_01650 [Rhodospirillaceae bacterium TMED167]
MPMSLSLILSAFPMDSPFYLFMHIPKTAGTTFRSIVDKQYGFPNVLTYYNQNSTQLLDNLEATLQVGSHDYRALIGHFQYGVHAPLTRPSKYITFLRNPVERAISSYHENVKIMSPAVRDGNGELMSFGECLREREEFFANQQTKMISGKGSMEPVDASDLERAQKNIQKDFMFIGISEYFDASILLLSRLIHWRPCTYGKLNARSNKGRLDGQELFNLQKINHFDAILYKNALDDLLRDMRGAGKKFDAALAELAQSTSVAAVTGTQAAHALSDDHFAIKSFIGFAEN